MSRFSPGVIFFTVFSSILHDGFTYSISNLESLRILTTGTKTRSLQNLTTDTLSFREGIQLSEALLAHPVVIAHYNFQNSSEQMRQIEVNVDPSVTELVVGICHTGQGPLSELLNQTGVQDKLDKKAELKGPGWEIVSISNPTKGKWQLNIPDNSSYELIFLGESNIDLDAAIVDKATGEIIKESPLTGSEAWFMFTLTNTNNLSNTSRVILVKSDGSEISTYPFGNPHGREKNVYLVQARIPDQTFKVKVFGYVDEPSSTTITRISHVTFTPVTFSLSVSPVLPDTMQSGSKLNVAIVLHNSKSMTDIFNLTFVEREKSTMKELFRASWSNVIVRADTTSSYPVTITQFQDVFELECIIQASNGDGMTQTKTTKTVVIPTSKTKGPTAHSHHFEETSTKDHIPSTVQSSIILSRSVSLHVTDKQWHTERTHEMQNNSYRGITTSSQHNPSRHSKRTKLTTKKRDLKPPSFIMIKFKDRCKHRETCSLHQWTVFFQVQDNESGIHRIDVEDKTFSTVITEGFSDGQANTPIHGNVSTTCCHGDTAIIVEDKQGNRLRYPVRYIDHVAQDTGFSFNTYSGIVVGSLACVMLLIIIVTTIVHFRSKLCFYRQTGFAYRQSIDEKLSKSHRTRTKVAQVI